MSDKIIILYKEEKKSCSIPKNYLELQKSFISLFNINEKDINLFSFKYTNLDGDEILIEEDEEKSFEETISNIKESNSNIFVKKMEDLDDIEEENKNYNNEALRSGIIFKPSNQNKDEEYKKQIKELEIMNKEIVELNKKLIREKGKLEKEKKEIINSNNKLIKSREKIKNELQELQEKQKQYESSIDFNTINNKNNEINELKQKLEDNKTKLEKYEKEINEYKSQIEQSKIDILNLKKSKDIEEKEKEKEKYFNEFIKKKYEEKAKEEINKINQLLQKKLEEKTEKIKLIYEKKYKEAEEKFEQISQVMMSNMSNVSLSNTDKSSNKNEHKGIKCERCFIEPIIGYRYKCSVCNNYNLCSKCEEENQNTFFHNHEHDFIKMRKTRNANE